MSIVTRLLSRAGRVPVGAGAPGDASSAPRAARRPAARAYLAALALAAVTTAASALLFGHLDRADIIMLYLLGVVVVAARWGGGPATLSAVLAVAAFDLFYVPPYLTFAVSHGGHLVTFAVMLLVGLVISALTAEIRRQADAAREREARTAALYSLSRELTQLRLADGIAVAAAREIGAVLEARVAVLLVAPDGSLAPVPGTHTELVADAAALAAAHEALARGRGEAAAEPSTRGEAARERPAVRGEGEGHEATARAAAGRAVYLPLTAADRAVGVLGLVPAGRAGLHDADSRALLETFARQTAIALQRALLAQEAQASELRARTEELRSSLLSSVSHDLRTPLAAVTGAASTLLTRGDALAPTTRRDLLQAIHEEATRLGRLVANLLDMTRLESGTLALRPEWTPIEEPIGAALGDLEAQLEGREVRVTIAPDLPLVLLDAVLVEQMLVNLLENAVKYAGAGPIEVRAALEGDEVVVEVADRGPGIPAGDERRIFEKFHRAAQGGRAGGVGLGLAICRAVATAHGARIEARARAGGGAVFRASFPRRGDPPPLPEDAAQERAA